MFKGMAVVMSFGVSVPVFAFASRCAVADSGDSGIPRYGWGAIAMMVMTETRFFPLISSRP
jgi:hypothetical protein